MDIMTITVIMVMITKMITRMMTMVLKVMVMDTVMAMVAILLQSMKLWVTVLEDLVAMKEGVQEAELFLDMEV